MPNIHTLIEKKEKARVCAKRWYHLNKSRLDFKSKARIYVKRWRTENPSKYLLQHARQRAKIYNVLCDLTLEDIIIPDQCPVLKVPFEYGTRYAMSLDRINPELGYTKDNIQVISWKANMMKQDASLEELRKFAQWVKTLTV